MIKKIILTGIGISFALYFLLFFVFQIRNPTANESTFFTEAHSILAMEKLDRYQGN